MAELRYHPLIDDWIMIASHRQNRPQMPRDWCPFCPGSGKVPEQYDVLKYDNDFPALSQNPPEPDEVADEFFRTEKAYGKCEVILYSPDHHASLSELPQSHLEKLTDLWIERFLELSGDPLIKYIFIFENRGDVVGVTMPHPHGQIYGYGFIPKKIRLELDSARKHREKTGGCLFCDLLSQEQKDGRRIIFENEHFTVFLPFFSEYPYGVYIFPKRHFAVISEMSAAEKSAFSEALRQTTGMLDCLFDMRFPYMMCMHNAPVNLAEDSSHYHFHVEFFPPMRSGDKIKYNASSETGVWAHCNPTAPEEKAVELRAAHQKFLNKKFD